MLNIRHRSRLFGLVAVCAVGLLLTGCVAYGDGGYAGGGDYGPSYGGGGYYGGSNVNIYAPRYRNASYRHDGGYHHNPRHDGGGYHNGGNHHGGGNQHGGGYQHGGGRPEAHNQRQERRQSYGG